LRVGSTVLLVAMLGLAAAQGMGATPASQDPAVPQLESAANVEAPPEEESAQAPPPAPVDQPATA
jgi:hypothetical protein